MGKTYQRTKGKLTSGLEVLSGTISRESVAKSLLWAGMMVATLGLAIAYTVDSSVLGGSCSSAACSYIDDKGQSFPGTCGSKKGDDKHCYCFNKQNKKLSQEQSGCSIK